MSDPPVVIPVQPGYSFECQQCGDCCRGMEGLFVNAHEILMVKKFDVWIFYKLMVQETDGVKKTFVIPSIAQYDLHNDGTLQCYCLHDGRCLIHDIRPTPCSQFPYVLHTFFSVRPSPDQIRAVLGGLDIPDDATLPFLHKTVPMSLHEEADCWHVLAARTRTSNGTVCPGVGKGDPWDEAEVRKFILQRFMTYIDHPESVRRAISLYTGMLVRDFEKHFEPVDGRPGFFRARQRDIADIVAELERGE